MARRRERDPDFLTYLFKEDIERIKNWVLQYPDLETGGSLFGLWTSGENPVVHIVLGPAEGCRRTNVSFFQDVGYLQRVGELLTTQYMLCHIGEWHSHHCMRLSHPSEGDVSTVVRNYPQGACGFLLMIANIMSESTVTISPYKFQERTRTSYQAGKVVILDGDSPFRNEEKIQRFIGLGAEEVRLLPRRRNGGLIDSLKNKMKDLKDFACTSFSFTTEKEKEVTPMDIDQDNERQKGRGRSPERRRQPRDVSPTKRHQARARSPEKRQTRAESPERRQTRRDTLTRSAINQQATAPRYPPSDRSPRRTVRALPEPTAQTVEASKCTKRFQWYSKTEGEELLKTFFNCISSIPGTQDIEMTREPKYQNLTISFMHHDVKWIVNFPSDFPKGCADLKQEVPSILSGSHTRFIDMISELTVYEGEPKIREKITSNCQKCRTTRR